MPTTNIVPFDLGTFVNESVSFTSAVGDQSSFRSAPAGYCWVVQTLRALNGEATAKNMAFLLADAAGVTHAILSMTGTGPTSVAAGGTLAWNGKVIIPPGWRVYASWLQMTGGSTCNWQYTAIEVALEDCLQVMA